MTLQHAPDVVLLVFGILAMAKSIWAIAKPGTFQRVTTWWLGAVAQINTLTGCLCALVAVGLWVLVLIHQPLTNWVLTALGAVCAGWAALYFRPPGYQKAIGALVINRTPGGLRALFLLIAVLGLAMVLIALRGLARSG